MGFEQLRERLINEEVEKLSNDTSADQAAIQAIVPMVAGALVGRSDIGAKVAGDRLVGYGAEQDKNKSKLLEYLAKLKTDKADKEDWELKAVDGKMVKMNKKSGEIVETEYQPPTKETLPNWQQIGGTKTATLFRKNPETGLPEIYDTGKEITQRPLSPFLSIASKRLEEDIKEREEKKIQGYASDVEPLAPLGQSISTIETYLNKYPNQDLPGVGALDIMAGKFGLKADLKNPKLSPEEAMFVNTVNELKRSESMRTGGKALTQTEMELVDRGIGLLNKGGEANFREGMRYVRQGYDSAMSRAKAKYPSKASETFKQRGGDDMPKTAYKQSPSKESAQKELDSVNEELRKRGLLK